LLLIEVGFSLLNASFQMHKAGLNWVAEPIFYPETLGFLIFLK
tara:strand:- start:1226 stop:1354 length:129 start_codon:yes stop_codon:yes gene_type:complete